METSKRNEREKLRERANETFRGENREKRGS